MKLLPQSPWMKSALTVLSVVLFTLAALGVNALGVTDAGIVLTLLMAVVLSSWAFGLPYSVLSSALAILVHSFFFSIPIYSFEVYNQQHVVAFGFMIAVGLVVGTLSGRLRDQVSRLAVREERLEALHRLGQSLSGQIDRLEVIRTAESLLSTILDCQVKIADPQFLPTTGTRAFALTGSQQSLGWLTVHTDSGPDPFLPERRVWIETLLAPVALALERVALIEERQNQSRDLEATLTRNTILHGISHDLRTPLTVISATAGSLLEQTSTSDPRRADMESLSQESQSLVHQVENLLELTSLTSGSVVPRLEWVPLEELIYPCLEAVAVRFPELKPECRLPEGGRLCQVDETLINKALHNLLENAALYAPGTVEVSVVQDASRIRFNVADRGPGVAEGERKRIFGQFARGGNSRRAGTRGSGLGLALVQSIAGLHGGTAGVEARQGGGAIFWFDVVQSEPTPALWGGEA